GPTSLEDRGPDSRRRGRGPIGWVKPSVLPNRPMKGLIFNLLADLARRAGCEDDAWQVALSVSEEVAEELAFDDFEDEEAEIFEMLAEASLQGGADFTFRWLLRSGSPFCDEDWDDLTDMTPLDEARGALDLPESRGGHIDVLGRRRP